MQCNVSGAQRLEFNLDVTPCRYLTEAIDPRLALDALMACERSQEVSCIIKRGLFLSVRTGQRFDHVAAHQLRPVALKQLGRREDVAPRHLAPISDDHTYHRLALQLCGAPG